MPDSRCDANPLSSLDVVVPSCLAVEMDGARLDRASAQGVVCKGGASRSSTYSWNVDTGPEAYASNRHGSHFVPRG